MNGGAAEDAFSVGAAKIPDLQHHAEHFHHKYAGGDDGPLIGEIKQSIEQGVGKRFGEVKEKEKHKDDSVDAGREYVRAYVEFVHYVEGLHTAAGGIVPVEAQVWHEHAH